MTLRYIHVGVGGWGLDWEIHPIPRVSTAERVACVDSSPEILAAAKSRLKLDDSRCFATLAEAMASVEADAVLVTVPLRVHAVVTLEALQAGKHVLVEKPFATSVAEAREMVETAAAQHRTLMVSQNYRHFPAPMAVRHLIASGELGSVGEVHIDFRRHVTAATGGHRHFSLENPLLVDMAIHHFDLMRFILGSDAVEISCTTWNPVWSPFSEHAAGAATVAFANGVHVAWRGSWVSPEPETNWAGEWHVECEYGEIIWTSRGNDGTPARDRVIVRRSGKAEEQLPLEKLVYYGRSGTLNAFAASIAAGKEPPTSGRDNLASLDLAYSAVRSAAERRAVSLPSF